MRSTTLHLKKDAALGGNDELPVITLHSKFQQFGSGPYHIGQLYYGTLALGVYQHLGIRVLLLETKDGLGRETLMDMAGAVPE